MFKIDNKTIITKNNYKNPLLEKKIVLKIKN